MPASHWTPEEFRAAGHAAVDWIADYQARIEDFPVQSRVRPGDIAALLPKAPPAGGAAFESFLADVDSILPGITHWQHPGFFGYFPANASGPAILGDLLSSGLGVQGMVWATSPAATEVETRVLDWFAELLDLPERFRFGKGVIQDTASSATLTALVAALHRVSHGDVRANGLDRRYTVYCSDQAHSSVAKAVTVTGVGAAQLRVLPTAVPAGPIDVAALAGALSADRDAGLVPAMIVSAVGTTGTGAVDDTAALGRLAAEYGAWLHVDAAWAGVAAVAPEFRGSLNSGLSLADSYATNPHKWLLTNFDCDTFYVGDPLMLNTALAENRDYLGRTDTDVIDYRDWHIPLGRRFRALKLWAVLSHYGAEGLSAHVRDGVRLADQLAAALSDDPHFEIVSSSLSLVCFRRAEGADGDAAAADRATLQLLHAVNDSGQAFLSQTTVAGRPVIRVAIGAPTTTDRHVDALVDLLAKSMADAQLV